MPPIRYMGTKYGLRDDILGLLLDRGGVPKVVIDPFCGTGAVATWLADGPSVRIGDALSFPLAIARATVLPGEGVSQELEAEVIRLAMSTAESELERFFGLVREETFALDTSPEKLQEIIAAARHVGNDGDAQRQASEDVARGGHSLCRLYFARGYFSTTQAIVLDALRDAIDTLSPTKVTGAREWTSTSPRDILLARWLSVASGVANSPGHTAQFLQARTRESMLRVRRAWRLDPIERFRSSRWRVQPRGGAEWRAGNAVLQSDALETLAGVDPSPEVVVYADPPYTRDQYSRMYHVLETMYLYDYPDSIGAGRARSGRVRSAFSSRREAKTAFAALLSLSAGRGMRTVISYPSSGLLRCTDLLALMEEYGSVEVIEIPLGHSTLGGRRGRGRISVVEGLYVVTP